MRAKDDATPLTETPEFKDALAAESAKLRAEFRAEMADMLRAAAPQAGVVPAAGGEAGWMQALAQELGTLTEQGVQWRRRVPAEVVRQRKLARERMEDLIVAAAAAGRKPEYRLRNKVHFDERRVEPVWIDNHHTAQPTDIVWPGIPNEAMIPINPTAAEIHAAFMESIGNIAKSDQVAEKLLKVTRGGLVVKGAPSPAAHQTALNSDGSHRPAGEQGLELKHEGRPGRYKAINILGTIAAPAQQSI